MKGERFGFGGDVVKWGFPGMGDGFVLLADGAPLDVVRYPLLHSGPLGMLTCLPKGLVSSGVSSGGVVMVDSH